MVLARFSILGAMLLVAGCRSTPPEVLYPEGEVLPAIAPSAAYIVGPGDVLRVNVFGHPDLSSPMLTDSTYGSPIGGDGMIQLPLLDPLEVGGHPLLEVRDIVTGALKRYLKQPKVDVAVVRFGAHRVVVLGDVTTPGVYVMERPQTVLEILAHAGGFLPSANRRYVVWMRGGLAPENLTLLDFEGLDATAALPMGAGDVLFIGRRKWADRAEAIRDVIPLLQAVAIPISTATQLITLEKLLR